MRVLYLTSWYKRPGSPNSGYFFYQLAEGMTAYADEVIVACVHIRFIGIIDRIGLQEKHTGKLHEYVLFVPALIPRWKWLYTTLGRFYLPRLIKKLEKRHGKFDVIHLQSALMAALHGEPYLCRCGIPIVYTEHSSRVLNDTLNCSEKAALAVMQKYACQRYAVSKMLASRMKKYVTTVNVIGNIVDFESETQITLSEAKTDKFTFVCLGTLRKDKGMVELIEAFADAFGRTENVRLLIGGEGEYRERIAEAASRFKDYDIHLLGEVPHAEVSNLFAQSNCFVLPSKYETFGIAYIEAIACGLPVIATRCGGPEEFVTDENGLLVEVGNHQQLCTALRTMYEHPEKYDRNHNREVILQKYSKKAVCDAYYHVYQEVTN